MGTAQFQTIEAYNAAVQSAQETYLRSPEGNAQRMKGNKMRNLKQTDTITCELEFAFKVNGKGRAITVRQGDVFWLTTSSTNPNREFARKGASVGSGYQFSHDMLMTYFS